MMITTETAADTGAERRPSARLRFGVVVPFLHQG